MFHVMLVLPVLFAAGAVLLIPYAIGCLLQFVFTIFCRRWYILCLPAFLGAAGAAASLLWLGHEAGPGPLLYYWLGYFLLLLLVFAVVFPIKYAVQEQISKHGKKEMAGQSAPK